MVIDHSFLKRWSATAAKNTDQCIPHPKQAMLTKEQVIDIIDIYAQAWVAQNKDRILTSFNKDATYRERAFEESMRGHRHIAQYWQTKAIASQSRILFQLSNLYMKGEVAIAKWEAEFENLRRGTRKQMSEVAILEFQNQKIQSLREYWCSKKG